MQKITIEKGQADQRLDKFLNRHLPNAGTSFIYKMLRKKNITLNGKKAEGKELLTIGDEVSFFFSDETYQKFTMAEEQDLEEYFQAYKNLQGIAILYEDEQVLILNKPAGILSQKAQIQDQSINEWLIGYLLSTKKISTKDFANFHPSVCNRLDRNTSGLLLCGKTLEGSQELSFLIKNHQIRKFYQLFVKGKLVHDQLLEGYLFKDELRNRVTLSQEEQPGSSYIKTAYTPLKCSKELTFLEVELFTGKTHQIRSHLAFIGHPLVGDYKYGNKIFNDNYKKMFNIEAQLLHSQRVEFPENCGRLSNLNHRVITAPLPPIFQQILKAEVWQ